MVSISTTNNDISKAPFKLIPLFTDDKTKYLSPKIGTAVIDKCVELGCDTIILSHPYMAPLIFRKARKKNLRVIMYAHNIEYQRFRSMGKIWWPILYLIERWSMRFADYVLFVSHDDITEAIKQFGVSKEKLISTPFLLAQDKNPPNRLVARQYIRQQLALPNNTKLLYFYGPMDYLPNRTALKLLLEELVPKLQQKGIPFLLTLSGKNLDTEMERLISRYPEQVKWLGFVDDFEMQLQGSDIMLNPIWLGGGVKIKLMEALANGVTAISFQSGALGIDSESAKNKLFVVPDQDTEALVNKIVALTEEDILRPTPNDYYQHYTGKKVIARVLSQIGKA